MRHILPLARLCSGLAWLLLGATLVGQQASAQDASTIGNGIISTYAGLPPGINQTSPAVDDLPASQYKFLGLSAIISDSNGNLYIADQDANGYKIFLLYNGGTVPALLNYRLTNPPSPYTATTATVGNLYIIAGVPGSVGTTDSIQSVCQPASTCGDGGSALLAPLNLPYGLALDSSGSLYIADEVSNAIRKVDATNGQMSTIVGDPMHSSSGYSGEGVAAAGSLLTNPDAVAFDSAGNLYISDSVNYIIRRVDAQTHLITTVAGTVPSGGVGVSCTAGPCGDGGLATSATLGYGTGVYVAANGDLYITDNGAATIRKVDATTHIISTVAGTMATASQSFPQACADTACNDGGPATAALLNGPYQAGFDANGHLLFADSNDDTIRYVDTSGNIHAAVGVISQAADVSGNNYGGDGNKAVDALLYGPNGYAFDAAGNLYVLDALNDVIRKVAAPSALTAQTITFGSLPDLTYGATPVTLDATATSGLTVTYTVTGPATVSGSTLSITGAGTVAVTAHQSGNGTYAAANPVSQSFTVAKATLTATADNKSRAFGVSNPPLTYTLTGFVGSDTSSAVTGMASLSTTATTNSAIGTYPITIALGTLTAANYSFTLINGTLSVVGGASQTITFNSLPNIVYGSAGSTFTLSATASSGLAVSYSVTGPAQLQGSKLTVNGAGTVSVTASQPGDATYGAAPSVTQSFTVQPAVLTIQPAPATRQYGQPNPAFTYIATGFVSNDTAAVLSGAPVYSTTATPSSDPATFPVTLVQGTLFAQNYTFTFVPGTLVVTTAAQTITFPPLPALNGSDGQFQLQGSASSGLPLTYTATGVVSIVAGNILQVNGVGAASVTASQPGNVDYAPAPSVTQNIVIAPISLPVIAVSASRPFGADNPVLTYRFGQVSIVPGSITGAPQLTTTATAQSPTGDYPITISQGTLSSSEYSFIFVPGTLTVTPAASYILTADPQSVTIPIGQSRQVTITMTPLNDYQGTVTLGCANLPAGVTCTASPTTLTTVISPGGHAGPVQGTLTISAGQVVAGLPASGASILAAGPAAGALSWPALLGAIAAGFCLLVGCRRSRHLLSLSLAVVALLTLGGMSACGGGGSGNGSGVKAGTTTIQVTGLAPDATGAADLSQSVSLQVIIQ